MKRLVLAGCLALVGCHDFAAELAQCIDAGACVSGSTTEIPSDAKIEVDSTFTTAEFRGWPVGGTSDVFVVPFKNKGAKISGALVVALSGANADNFTVATDGCGGRQLESSATCVVALTFSPLTAAMKSADLNVSADPGGSARMPLTGQGLDPARLDLAPLVKNFGPITAGGVSTSETFTLSNSGSVNATGLTVQLEGNDAGAFVISSNGCPQSLGATACVVVARFEPRQVGAFTANLVARADNGLLASSTLVGDGTAPPGAQLTANLASVDFQNWNVGATSTAEQVIINNIGGQVSGPIAVNLAGANGSDFAVSVDGCSGMMLAPLGSCTVQLTFSPTGAAVRTATLSAVANPGGAASVQLRGTGQTPAALSFTPSPWDFGSYALDAGAGRSFTLTNLGTLPATNLTVQITDVDAGLFVLTTNMCAQTLAGASNCQVYANFTATTVGQATAALRAQADGVLTQADLSGTGLAASTFLVTPSAYDFGPVVRNLFSAPLTVTVQNIGAVTTSPLTITPTGAFTSSFPKSADSCTNATLLPSQSCTFVVTFNPKAYGDMLVSVQISATVGGVTNANLSGRGISEANLVISPSSWNFGDVDAGAVASFDFTVTNVGEHQSGPLSLSTLTRDGGAWFVLGGGDCSGAQLVADAGCTQTVSFAPPGYGPKLGALTVLATPGADGGGTAAASLSGFGHALLPIVLSLDAGMGTAVVLPDGGSCTSSCTLWVEGGVPTPLVAVPARGWFFGRWSSSTVCDAGVTNPTCTVMPSGASVPLTAYLDHYNFAFVTSNKYLGSATFSCDAMARDGGLPGTYVKMRTWYDPVGDCGDGGMTCGSQKNFTSLPAVYNSSGWVRTDGKPFVQDFGATYSGSRPMFPLSCDEHANCLNPAVPEWVWTGETVIASTSLDPNGPSCNNWTSASSGVYGTVGNVFGAGGRAYDGQAADQRCNAPMRFACLETDKAFSFGTRFNRPVPPGGRRAFLSALAFSGSTTTATANQICRNEATDGGLPNATSFLALRGTTAAAAVAGLNLDGGDWYRVDGQLVTTPAALGSFGPTVLEAPLNMNARGVFRGTFSAPALVWTGGSLDGGPGKFSGDAGTNSCANWSTGSSGATAATGSAELTSPGFWGDALRPCNGTASVYCFEN